MWLCGAENIKFSGHAIQIINLPGTAFDSYFALNCYPFPKEFFDAVRVIVFF